MSNIKEFTLYRYYNENGSSKDWAVRDNKDGTFTAAWGKTGATFQLKTTDKTGSPFVVDTKISEKLRKGYNLVSSIYIDLDTKEVTYSKPVSDMNSVSSSDASKIHWSFLGRFYKNNLDEVTNFHQKTYEIISNLYPDFKNPILNPGSGSFDISLDNAGFFVFLMAFNKEFSAFKMVDDVGIAISDELKNETEILKKIGCSIDDVRVVAENLHLLVKPLDFSNIGSEQNFYF